MAVINLNAIMTIMLRVQFLIKVIIPLLVLTACTAVNKPSNIRDSIFPSSCTNACWLGIKPTITDNKQAFQILVNNYGSENVTLEDFNNQSMLIHWVSDDHDWLKKGTVYIIENKVLEIALLFDKGVGVGDFIETMGEPDFVNGTVGAIVSNYEFKCAGIVLTYPSLGLMASPLPYEDSLGVYESQQINYLTIRQPWDSNETPWTDSFNMAWDGYHEYCQMP